MKLTLLAALATLSTLAAAQDLEGELRRCRGIAEVATRVACYDALPLKPAPAPSTPSARAAPAVPAPAAMAPAVAATPPAPAVAPPASFGLPQSSTAQEAQSTVQSSVPGSFDGWSPNTRIRLANGQVWQVTDGSSAAVDLKDPKVRVTRTAFGSYVLEVEGLNRTARVRRVE